MMPRKICRTYTKHAWGGLVVPILSVVLGSHVVPSWSCGFVMVLVDSLAFLPLDDLPNISHFTFKRQSHLTTIAFCLNLFAGPYSCRGSRKALVTQHEASSFTLHSLKCALLSAAAQLRLPEDSRRLQGHRRLSSALLYSRDDTIEALWVQSELASAIRRGWRPPRPMARGGQRPTVEPAFQVPQGSEGA